MTTVLESLNYQVVSTPIQTASSGNSSLIPLITVSAPAGYVAVGSGWDFTPLTGYGLPFADVFINYPATDGSAWYFQCELSDIGVGAWGNSWTVGTLYVTFIGS